jgi:starch synthase (maltosyl-transferring)
VNKSIHSWIAVSNAARDRMIQRGEAAPQKIVVIRNGVQDLRRRHLVDPALVRRELGINVDAPVAVCVGRLEPEKSVTTLIAAWQRIAKERADARCIIVGGGSEEARLAAQVRDANLAEVVKFVGFRDDAASVMNSGDLLVLPSLAESFGLVLLEAMSLSKAVVSTRSGGPEEIVQHAETGLLVPTASPEALADAILRLLNDPVLRLRLGRAGRARFCREFSIETMARATAAVYRAIVNNEPVPLVPSVQSAVGSSVEVC